MQFKWPKSIPEDQVDHIFIQGMLDRMAVGYHNYGHARRRDMRPDCLKSLEMRLKKYKETGNTEWLMDAANFAMMEFMVPSHKDAHFKSTTKQESPGAKFTDGSIYKGKEHYK